MNTFYTLASIPICPAHPEISGEQERDYEADHAQHKEE